jgi:hypothetical protein
MAVKWPHLNVESTIAGRRVTLSLGRIVFKFSFIMFLPDSWKKEDNLSCN